ncbi:26911_t:CDS:2 [Racocetra persica]|uniref:26911_t:CDS:1 n=1 Tax=Racocetra persica TaxID=160502 RepID=A0ACA9S6W6_9GLOM|nr:26911_t:CDS:2 [Racocetra persica]
MTKTQAEEWSDCESDKDDYNTPEGYKANVGQEYKATEEDLRNEFKEA